MKVREYKSLSEYLDQRLWDDNAMIFRGVCNNEFRLIPSIGRLVAINSDSLLAYEKKVLIEFKERAFKYLSREPRNDYEWLFLAQHYGIPTRLLDWTENPLVALYFACEKEPEKAGAVYKVTMLRWYENLDGSDPFASYEVGGIRPAHRDIRYSNQSGVFTIQPNPTKPLEYDNILKCTFNPTVKETIRWQLRKMGVHSSLIFPGLDSLAKDIASEFECLLKGGTVRSSGSMFEL